MRSRYELPRSIMLLAILCWCSIAIGSVLGVSSAAAAGSGGVGNEQARFDPSETTALMRIPTGSRSEAQRVERELDRVGLGLYFDRSRVLHHMEAALTIQKIKTFSQTPDSLFRATIPDWEIVRNLTRTEPIQKRSRGYGNRASASSSSYSSTKTTHGGAGGYLPIHKNKYHDLSEIEHTLRALTHRYPDRAELRTIGRSTRGANIWNLELGTRYHHGNNTPSLLLMGSLHGDDVVGTEFCLWLAEYLCEEYATSTAVRFLMDKFNIQLIPVPNPDAFLIGLRYTTKGIDLDRSFPDRISHKYDSDFTEKEVQVLMDWAKGYRPIAGAALLGGGGGPGPEGMVVRYPWNAVKHPSGFGGVDHHMVARAADDRAFRYLARSYADVHPTMAKNDRRPIGAEKGLVNGAQWYCRYGSFQDWFYNAVGSPYLDIVFSPYLKPHPEHLHRYWEDNKRAALAMIEMASGYGMRGVVVDAATGEPAPHAIVHIRDINDRSRHLHPIRTKTDPRYAGKGNFARFMVPGQYSVRVSAPGYLTTDERMFRIDDRHPIKVLRIAMEKPSM